MRFRSGTRLSIFYILSNNVFQFLKRFGPVQYVPEGLVILGHVASEDSVLRPGFDPQIRSLS